ncbi:MAG: SRPBCC family protein [Sphingomonadaceae bacterium]
MFTIENTILLPAPMARVWRLLVDVDRYRDWHPHTGLESDPADPRKLFYTYWQPGWKDPVISAEARVVRLKRPSDFAWRVGIKGLLQIEEGFHLEKVPQGTQLTHRPSCSGIDAWLGFFITRPFLRRRLVRVGDLLERHLRRGTVISRYAHRSARHH